MLLVRAGRGCVAARRFRRIRGAYRFHLSRDDISLTDGRRLWTTVKKLVASAPDANAEQPVGRDMGSRKNNLNVVAAECYATAFLRFIQGQCRERAAHLSGQETLALGLNDGADLLASCAALSSVHLISSGRCGCTGSP